MSLLTIKEFADKHGITRVAVETAMREGRLTFKEQYGKRLLYANKDYKPVLGRGRKPRKPSRK